MKLNRIEQILDNGEYKEIRRKTTEFEDVGSDIIYTIYTKKVVEL